MRPTEPADSWSRLALAEARLQQQPSVRKPGRPATGKAPRQLVMLLLTKDEQRAIQTIRVHLSASLGKSGEGVIIGLALSVMERICHKRLSTWTLPTNIHDWQDFWQWLTRSAETPSWTGIYDIESGLVENVRPRQMATVARQRLPRRLTQNERKSMDNLKRLLRSRFAEVNQYQIVGCAVRYMQRRVQQLPHQVLAQVIAPMQIMQVLGREDG